MEPQTCMAGVDAKTKHDKTTSNSRLHGKPRTEGANHTVKGTVTRWQRRMGHVELTQVLVKFLAVKGEQICTFNIDVKKQSSQACICSAMLVPFTSRFSRSCFGQCKRSGHQDAIYCDAKTRAMLVQC